MSREASFFDLPEDALRFVFDLNLLGTVLPCQVFGKRMAARGAEGFSKHSLSSTLSIHV